MSLPRYSARLLEKHTHPYILCIIDMQPFGFNNSNLVLPNVLRLVRRAVADQAFIVISHYKKCGATHPHIIQKLNAYPHQASIWHGKNDKSKPIQMALAAERIFVRQIKVCGVNTEYCVKATVHGLAKKYNKPIKVIEKACHGTDGNIITSALHQMRTAYWNVEVV